MDDSSTKNNLVDIDLDPLPDELPAPPGGDALSQPMRAAPTRKVREASPPTATIAACPRPDPAPRYHSNGGAPAVRIPPHSLEMEAGLLSCIFTDSEVIKQCLEQRVLDAFSDPKHRIVFECQVDLYNRGVPVDVAIVAEELKAARQLDAIGGYAFLIGVSSSVPTTAHAKYFIEKVLEFALLREIIRTATRTVEECYDFTSGDVDEFAARQAEQFELLAGKESSGSMPALLARAIATEIDPAKPPPPGRPIFYIGGKVISTGGNLTAVNGRAKTAKSAVIGAAQSACIVGSGLGDRDADTLGMRSADPEGRAVVSIDTEQSPSHAAENFRRTLTRAGVEPTAKPEWLHHYPLAGWKARELSTVLPAIIKAAAKAHGGVHAVFIDGGADFTTDVNDAESASELCSTWQALAIAYGCMIGIVIHSNEGRQSDDIARGWLGKQLRRKSESNLTLKRDGDVIVLYGEDGQRHAPIPERDGPRFSWDPASGMFRSCESLGAVRTAAETAELRDLADEVFAGNRLRYSDVCEKIEKARRVGGKAGEKWFTRMKKANVIRNVGFGQWEVIEA